MTKNVHISQLLTRASQSVRIRFLLFFVLLFMMLLSDYKQQHPWDLALILTFIATSFYVAVVYLNYSMLFPIAKKKDKFLWFTILLLSLSILLTPMKSLLLYVTHRAFDPDSIIRLSSSVSDMLHFLWSNFISLLVVGVLSTIVLIFAGWIQSQRTYRELQNKSITTELKFLKSQINPHFLFNTLNNLYALTLKKSDTAPEVVLKLSNMMRYMLYECNEPQVPLTREIEYLKNYIDLEVLRYGNKVDVHINIEGESDSIIVPPLLLVPFMENAFKHGLQDKVTDAYLEVDILITERLIRYSVENSKSQLPQNPPTGNKKVGGIGLKNLRRRLEILYPDRHQMHLEESPTWYKATMSLLLGDQLKDLDIFPDIQKQRIEI